jgi:hypothetical protein
LIVSEKSDIMLIEKSLSIHKRRVTMKKSRTVLCFLAAAGFVCTLAFAQEMPNFAPGQYLLSNNKPLLGDNAFSDPCVADFNNDGKKDLMVGYFYYGNINLYLNEGTDSDPVFGEGTKLEADGQPILVGSG